MNIVNIYLKITVDEEWIFEGYLTEHFIKKILVHSGQLFVSYCFRSQIVCLKEHLIFCFISMQRKRLCVSLYNKHWTYLERHLLLRVCRQNIFKFQNLIDTGFSCCKPESIFNGIGFFRGKRLHLYILMGIKSLRSNIRLSSDSKFYQLQ